MSEFQKKPSNRISSNEASKFILSEEEINKLIISAKDLRDRLLIEMLVFTGARRAEIILVRRLDIDLDKNIIRMPTVKRRGDPYSHLRTVPIINEAFRRDLEYYMQITDLQFKPSQYEKLLRHSNNRSGEGLSTIRINQILKEISERAKVSHPNRNRKNLNPHCLRHSFCRVAIRRGMNIKSVSQILGHKSVAVTLDIYGSFSDDELVEESKKMKGYGETVGHSV